jgi:hypothetical protein
MVSHALPVTPPTLGVETSFGPAPQEQGERPGRAIVLLTTEPCLEYEGTRCVMEVVYEPGWTLLQAREALTEMPQWAAPHLVMLNRMSEWVIPSGPGRPGEHSPLHRARRRLRQMRDQMEAEIGELRGEDDYTEQQAMAQAYQAALDVLDEMFGAES